MRNPAKVLWAFVAVIGLMTANAMVGAAQEESTFSMSLDQLLSVQVESVTRSKGMSLFDAPAALSVIGQEDIRRNGYQQLPEVLRLAQGLQVARLDGGTWAISARGYNNRYNRMQLVQMDGRSLYNIIFGGVFWGDQDYVMDDLDRIEVIRGPGATLWGANAINGIISVISKPASRTQGWLFRGRGGTQESGIGALRYGDQLSKNVFYRVYMKSDEISGYDTYAYNSRIYDQTAEQSEFFTPGKSDDLYSYNDGYRKRQFGFRMDWQGDEDDDSFTLQGDTFRSNRGDSLPYATYSTFVEVAPGMTVDAAPLGNAPTAAVIRNRDTGWNLLGRWKKRFGENSTMQLQSYFDTSSVDYSSLIAHLGAKTDVFDLDFQHNFVVGKNHRFVIGADYRNYNITTNHDNYMLTIHPDTFKKDTLNGFFQDTFPVFQPNVELTIGSKFDRNDMTGGETQPSARLTYKPNHKNVFWTAVSKAVRTPSLTDTHVNLIVGGAMVDRAAVGFPPGTPLWVPIRLIGNSTAAEEEVVAYEIGWRTAPTERLSFDLTLFSHRGHHMLRNDRIVSALPPVIQFQSSGTARYNGAEAAANWIVNDKWRLSAGYEYLNQYEKSTVEKNVGKETPKNQARLRSYYDINRQLEFNTEFYYNDNILAGALPRSLRMDAGLNWKHPKEKYEVRLWAQGLLDSKWRESAPDGYTSIGAAELERSVYGELVWRF